MVFISCTTTHNRVVPTNVGDNRTFTWSLSPEYIIVNTYWMDIQKCQEGTTSDCHGSKVQPHTDRVYANRTQTKK